MRIQISYFDPSCPELKVVDGQNMTVIANNQDKYDSIMASITDPEREITNITEEELPPLSFTPLLIVIVLSIVSFGHRSRPLFIVVTCLSAPLRLLVLVTRICGFPV